MSRFSKHMQKILESYHLVDYPLGPLPGHPAHTPVVDRGRETYAPFPFLLVRLCKGPPRLAESKFRGFFQYFVSSAVRQFAQGRGSGTLPPSRGVSWPGGSLGPGGYCLEKVVLSNPTRLGTQEPQPPWPRGARGHNAHSGTYNWHLAGAMALSPMYLHPPWREPG